MGMVIIVMLVEYGCMNKVGPVIGLGSGPKCPCMTPLQWAR